MSQSLSKPGGRQFTIRTVLVATLFIALLFGWNASSQRWKEIVARLSMRATYAENELKTARARFQPWNRAPSAANKKRPKGVLSSANLDGANLRDASIVGRDSAFQNSSFNGCDLENASLQGQASSFQMAQFNNTNLVKGKLVGGGGSFQYATFINADLSGAVLIGGGSSFQVAKFEGAKLIGAKIICSGASFQGVNIDKAQFQGADLSAIDHNSLESCYFNTPPTYDEKTRFPIGFDPVQQLWQRVPHSP